MTLTEFLLARIAEDEAAARDVIEQHARDHGPAAIIDEAWARPYMNPARVLAGCERDRRIVAQVQREESLPDLGDPADGAVWVALDQVLRALALPYADHPDYREEWKP